MSKFYQHPQGTTTNPLTNLEQGRNFIGIELDASYFEIAKKRIKEAGQ